MNCLYSFLCIAKANPDSIYTPIERKPQVFQPLVIPRALRSALPYISRPKGKKADHTPGTIDDVRAQRPAVVLEPREQKVAKLMAMPKTRYEDRKDRLHVEAVDRLAAHRAVVQAEAHRKVIFIPFRLIRFTKPIDIFHPRACFN